MYGCVAAAVASNRVASIDPFDITCRSEAHTIKHRRSFQAFSSSSVKRVKRAGTSWEGLRSVSEILLCSCDDIDPANYKMSKYF